VVRIWTAAAGAAVAVLVAGLLLAAPAVALSQQEVTILSPDGTQLAATLLVPDGSPPAGGWPAVVFMHGLGGNRSSMNTVARSMGVAGEDYVVLTYDARGHGQSGGLIGIDGPREVADARAVFEWLQARPDVADTRIGAWGISYGGGAAWNSLVAGVPWAALEVVETWTDLYAALMPQGLAKSGVIGGFLLSLPPAKLDPAVPALRDAAFAGRAAEVAGFAAARSSLTRLKGVRTPVFLMQGRRDFAFGIDQATRPFALLAGPKRLWIGNHGHAPSTFPAADTPTMLAEGKLWFDRYLRSARNGIDGPRRVVVAAEGSAKVTRSAALPRTMNRRFAFGGAARTITPQGKVTWRTARLTSAVEAFGSPSVKVDVRRAGGWTRLVAVLSARTPAGREIVISGGGVPLAAARATVTIRLLAQATFVPKGSRITLTLASSSLAQNPSNLLYLDLPLPSQARVTIAAAAVTVPVLSKPITT
jgi:predicted acyl esterase